MIDYTGLSTDSTDLLDAPDFIAALKDHGLVLTNEIAEHPENFDSDEDSSYILVKDPVTQHTIWVLYDDFTFFEAPHAGFEAVLRAMDRYSKENNGIRIFMNKNADGDGDFDVDRSHPAFNWEYSFVSNSYVNPSQ